MKFNIKRKYFFDCGMPRSGSTLLSALLNQNPKIHTEPISSVLEIMDTIKEIFNKENSLAYPKNDVFKKIIKSIIENYYSDRNEPIIIDKCRIWPTYIDIIKEHITPNPKILCTIRNPLDILASFIILINKNESNTMVSFIDKLLINDGLIPTNESRCDLLMSPGGIVWESLNSINNAIYNKNIENIHFIWYDDIINDINIVMKNIYNFLELDLYHHDFNNIKNKNRENDNYYGMPTMHEIKPKIQKTTYSYTDILNDEIINKYANIINFFNFLKE
jgi:sulfotransferase